MSFYVSKVVLDAPKARKTTDWCTAVAKSAGLLLSGKCGRRPTVVSQEGSVKVKMKSK